MFEKLLLYFVQCQKTLHWSWCAPSLNQWGNLSKKTWNFCISNRIVSATAVRSVRIPVRCYIQSGRNFWGLNFILLSNVRANMTFLFLRKQQALLIFLWSSFILFNISLFYIKLFSIHRYHWLYFIIIDVRWSMHDIKFRVNLWIWCAKVLKIVW